MMIEKAKFTDIDDFMRNLEKGCSHSWKTVGAVAIGVTPKTKRPVFSTIAQCIHCKDIMMGD